MFRKEDFESWNKLFSDCKINENDLAHPTEAFLTKTLIHYLRAFGYKVEPPFPLHLDVSENTREKRLFLAKLTRNIDHIYKITDKTYSFTYYDLIKPTPKKTSHMLGILLNYLFYYNMYKTNVFSMATDRLKERQELQMSIAKNEQENEQLIVKAKKAKDEIIQLAKELPAAKAELVDLKLERRHKKEYIGKLQSEVDELVAQIKIYQNQKNNLEHEIVPEIELRKLKTELGKIKADLEDLKQQEATIENTLKERKSQINSLQSLLAEINGAKDVVPIKLLEESKEINKQLEETIKQATLTKTHEQNLQKNIEKLNKSLKVVNEKSKILKNQYEDERNNNMQSITKKEKQCLVLKEQFKTLQEEEHGLECALQEQNDIQTYLAENISEIMIGYN